jgi:hypothetical protein
MVERVGTQPRPDVNGVSLHVGSGTTLSVAIDRGEYPIVFAHEDGRVVVQFGMLTGREATQAELDRLALALRQAGAGSEMTLTAARRQDYRRRFESVLHEVHVTVPGSPAPWVEAICGAWAVSCAEERSIEPLTP